VALAGSLRFDVHVRATDVDGGTVSHFLDRLVPNLSGTGPAALCIAIPPAPLADVFTGPQAAPGPDGSPDTFPALGDGAHICFDVVARMNTDVKNTAAPQIFHARLEVEGVTTTATGAVTVKLGTPRDVFFLVPPVIQNGPLPVF
jgi:hypothetical protein